MLCRKNIIIGFGIFLPVLLSVLFVSPSYATSVTCTIDTSQGFVLPSSGSYIDFSDFSCDTSSLDPDSAWQYFLVSTSATYSSGSSGSPFLCLTSSSQSSCSITISTSALFNFNNRGTSFSQSDIFVFDSYHSNSFNRFSRLAFSSSFTFTRLSSFYFSLSIDDSYSSSSCNIPEPEEPEPCPTCPTCPVVPENPYDDKLDNITRAIYVCAGVVLVIYFFYCIYRMLIRSSGVEK